MILHEFCQIDSGIVYESQSSDVQVDYDQLHIPRPFHGRCSPKSRAPLNFSPAHTIPSHANPFHVSAADFSPPHAVPCDAIAMHPPLASSVSDTAFLFNTALTLRFILKLSIYSLLFLLIESNFYH